MILGLGPRGPGFNSQNSPLNVWVVEKKMMMWKVTRMVSLMIMIMQVAVMFAMVTIRITIVI